MSAGVALVIIAALVLFIVASALVFVSGLLVDAALGGDDMAKFLVFLAYLVVWFIPTTGLALGYWLTR